MAAAGPNQETEVKVSSDGAQNFIDWYYKDINEHRSLSSYYVNASTMYTGVGATADIVINGAQLASAIDYEALLLEQRGGATSKIRVRYEVDGFDVQVLNPNFGLACPEQILAKGPDKSGGRISMAVQVSGILHLGAGADAPRKAFNEVFVLVPNWDAAGPRAPRNLKKWLILSQNYRTL